MLSTFTSKMKPAVAFHVRPPIAVLSRTSQAHATASPLLPQFETLTPDLRRRRRRRRRRRHAVPPLPLRKIHRLELSNFKSYAGLQTIGPLHDFTAIIGPNGAGKSNLMDAISFVLGIRSAHLCGTQLRDLIYAFDDRDKDLPGRKAFVRLVYRLPTGAELLFQRGITDGGGSEYRIDDRAVTWDAYNARLKELGTFVKARNFFVFKGDVESIMSKNPKELSVLLEQISGSDKLKKDYEDLEAEKARAEEDTVLDYQEKRSWRESKRKHKRKRLRSISGCRTNWYELFMEAFDHISK